MCEVVGEDAVVEGVGELWVLTVEPSLYSCPGVCEGVGVQSWAWWISVRVSELGGRQNRLLLHSRAHSSPQHTRQPAHCRRQPYVDYVILKYSRLPRHPKATPCLRPHLLHRHPLSHVCKLQLPLVSVHRKHRKLRHDRAHRTCPRHR